MKMQFAVIMMLLAGASVAEATQSTYTWVGGDWVSPHDWGTADNWLRALGGTRTSPDPTDVMLLTKKEDSCIVGSSTDETVGSLTVQGMALTVSGKLEVFNTYGTLALDLDSNDTIGQSVLNITGSEPGTTLAAIAGGANSGIMRLHTLINEEQTTPRTTVNHSSGEVEADRLEMDWSNYNLSGGILRTGEVVFFHERHDPEFKGLFHQTGGEHDCGYLNEDWTGDYRLGGEGYLHVLKPTANISVRLGRGDFKQEGGMLVVDGILLVANGTAAFTGGDTWVGTIDGDTGSLEIGDATTSLHKFITITDTLSAEAGPGEEETDWYGLVIGNPYYYVYPGSWCTFTFTKNSADEDGVQQPVDVLWVAGWGAGMPTLDRTTIAFGPNLRSPRLPAFAVDDGPTGGFGEDDEDGNNDVELQHYTLGELDVGADDATVNPIVLNLRQLTAGVTRAIYVKNLVIKPRGCITGYDAVPLYFENNGSGQLLYGGDADLDGTVSFKDYIILEANFGKSGTSWAKADFDGDGEVTFKDYIILEHNFGKSTESENMSSDAPAEATSGPAASSMAGQASSQPAALPTLTDLNGDGKIDDADMRILMQQIRRKSEEQVGNN